jgi:flavin-dependent dehydrogenase
MRHGKSLPELILKLIYNYLYSTCDGVKMVQVPVNIRLPLLFNVDELVIGGGLAGLPVAKLLAERGRSVLLVESDTFLGYEIGAYQRPWFCWDEQRRGVAIEWFPLEQAQVAQPQHSLVSLHMDRVKEKLERNLINAGVKLLYATRLIKIERSELGWVVVIGNKSGRQVIQTKRLIDASESGIAARLLGGRPCELLRGFTKAFKNVRRTLEFTRVKPGWSDTIPLPEEFGAAAPICLRQGAFNQGHVILETVLPMSSHSRSCLGDSEIDYQARLLSFRAAEFLVKNDPHFRGARLGWGSLRVVYGEAPDPLDELNWGAEVGRRLVQGEFLPDSCLVLKPIEPLDHWDQVQEVVGGDLEWRDENDMCSLRKLSSVASGRMSLGLLDDCEVAVTGGGTSGAVAAYTAGFEGARTTLIEMNSGLGGTSTYGAVSFYWFGYRNAFTGEIDRRVMQWNKRLGYVREDYLWGRKDNWNPEIRSFVLLEMCREAGVKVLLDCLTIGALCRGKKVGGVVVATPYGPRGVTSKVCVDATGDGDVAAFAGSDFIYGNRRDTMTMWASLGWFGAPGVYRGGNFATALYCGDVLDYSRFLIVNRRRGPNDLYDHAVYLAPRETRHILGDIVLDLNDQLLHRSFPDTVSLCLSNHDTKGKSAADIVYQGVLPEHLEIEIPYRAFIPRNLDSILVTGKALSCTHDALSALRMIDDLQQQGGAVGTAAAMAVQAGRSLRDIDVRKLQRKMIRRGLLSRRVLKPVLEAMPDYDALVTELTGDESFQNIDMDIRKCKEKPDTVIRLFLGPSDTVLPSLQHAYACSHGKRRLLIARLLLWHGDNRGVGDVIDEIERALDRVENLPRREGSVRYTQLYPDHGVMTEATYLVNALCRSNDPRIVGLLEKWTERIIRSNRDYRDLKQAIWNSIEAVAYVAERQPLPGMARLLKQLLTLPELQYRVVKNGFEIDLLGERLAYLTIILARALARCGEKEGLLLLAVFTADNRITLAHCALDELRTLTGYDCGNQPELWVKALEQWPAQFAPCPWTERMV